MHTYTTQAQIRKAFWEIFPELPRKKITNYSGNGKMYCTDTRCTFTDWIDSLVKSGDIPDELAERVTLP